MDAQDRKTLAIERFLGPYNCAQSVFSAFAPGLGLDVAAALRIAGAFGAGIAYTGETCGAVTGALMVIGLKYGKGAPDDDAAKELCQAKARVFLSKFQTACGTSRCRELTGYDVSDPRGLAAAKEAGVFKERCPLFVAAAMDCLEEIL
jgi:C_GCAxxG_C_C family probable redox protein